jgi:ferredoxin--NADP+ reductase
MEDADIIVLPEEVTPDALSQAYLDSDNADKKDIRNVEILKSYAERQPEGKKRKIVLRFLTSPIAITGDGHVEMIEIVKNELYKDERGSLRPRATDEKELIPVGLVFRSVGYRGVPLTDVPFYDKWGVIPNKEGRVLTEHETGEQVIGDYCVGWIKRGPSGIIGTNKPDSVETAKHLLDDMQIGKHLTPSKPSSEAIEVLLKERGVNYVTYADWLILDTIEQEQGEKEGRNRKKFYDVNEMLRVIAEHKGVHTAGD